MSRLAKAAVVLLGALQIGVPAAMAAPAASRQRAKAKAKVSKALDRASSFPKFCQQWMEKVWAREQQGAVDWKNDADGVYRTYVEYSREYQCTLTESAQPVGKILYRETWYERRGKTIAEAEANEPKPIKIFDTGEFFSYSNGKWEP